MPRPVASSTAYTVQQGILYTASRKDLGDVVPADLARDVLVALEATAEGRRRLAQLGRRRSRVWLRAQEAAVLPGILLHYPVRKVAIARAVEEALRAGATRVVVLAAGLDLLARRLALAWPDAQFVEVDLPATQADKRQALDALGPQPPNLWLLPADLSQAALPDLLAGLPVGVGGPTVVVAEALTMYLPAEAQRRLAAEAAEVCGPSGRFVVTFVRHTLAPGDVGPLLRAYLWFKREDLRSQLDPDEAVALLVEAGFSDAAVQTGPELTHDLLGERAPGRPHDAEFLVIADRASS
ncbi:MAG: class I SAM-dependent methyltransferase [Alphaproteobacteria bacterium]|nr:class I SAM-dependent methyltransferase [Alphaproteobacteria bacterium]